MNTRVDEAFQYIVVGGGSAGSIVAARLTQAGKQVLLLEAGGSDASPSVWLPAGAIAAYRTKNWRYVPNPDTSRYGLVESWPAGKVLGGGGSINGMVYVRGHRDDFDEWSRRGATGWDYQGVLPHFQRLETWSGGADAWRGGEGPIDVCVPDYEDETNHAFRESARSLGHPFNPDYNGEHQEGVGRVQVNMKRAIRSQSSRKYLRGAVAAKEHLTIRLNAFVRRVLFHGKRAVGVEYVHAGVLKRAMAESEIILSAGSIVSPKLLMLSGIGPADELGRCGIEMVHRNEAVGMNLQEHSTLQLRWKSSLPNANNVNLWSGLKAAAQFVQNGSGLLSTTVYQDQIFCRSSESLPAPDLQIAFANFALARKTDPRDGLLRVEPHSDTGVMICLTSLHPKGRGSVHLRSGNPEDAPSIDFQMFGCREDLDTMERGCERSLEILAQSPFAALVGDRFSPESECRSPDDWRNYIVRNALLGAHPVGTCRMGGDESGVVDPNLRVLGVEQLRVADASVMPTLTSGNTNCPSMMIGEKAASLILAG